jgi:quercetin dioxygenase-like cupin family protein
MATSRSTILPGATAGVVSLTNAAPITPGGIVSKPLLDAGPLRVVLFTFDAGQELTEHATPARALVQILGGRSEWTLGGEKRELRAGDFLHMPPGLPHAVRALEPLSMLLTLVREKVSSAPTSEDGLE